MEKKLLLNFFIKLRISPKNFITTEQLNKDPNRAIADFISGMTDRYAINLNKGI